MARRHAPRLVVVVAVAALAAVTALTVSASRPTDAAYPGANGRIAYGYGESYGYGGGAIWSANPDGSAPTMLSDSGSDRSPSYSPDGSRIAFERESGVAVMNADGSGQAQLLEGSHSTASETRFETEYETSEKPPRVIPVVRIYTVTQDSHSFGAPSFSPDGSQLVVEEDVRDTRNTSICAVEAEGDEKCLKGSEGVFYDYEFECSPCASRIVTVDAASGAETGTVAAASGGEYSRPGYYDPAYSVDGRIAFARWSPKGSGIFVVDAPGATPRQIVSGYYFFWGIDFSPDGSKLAFGRGGEIATVDVNGGPVTILPTPTPPGAYSDFAGSPAFSPDGASIAFDRTLFFSGGIDYGIYTMGADGSGQTRVIDGGAAPTWQPVSVPPPPVPPSLRSRKGKVRLDRKGRAKVGTIVCGSSPCKLKVLSARLKAGKKKCKVEVGVAKKLGAGRRAKVAVKVAGKCLQALKRSGKGRLTVKLRATDAAGPHGLKLKATLVPYQGKESKAHK